MVLHAWRRRSTSVNCSVRARSASTVRGEIGQRMSRRSRGCTGRFFSKICMISPIALIKLKFQSLGHKRRSCHVSADHQSNWTIWHCRSIYKVSYCGLLSHLCKFYPYSQGITSIVNLQHTNEHRFCGPGMDRSGFAYNPELFMKHESELLIDWLINFSSLPLQLWLARLWCQQCCKFTWYGESTRFRTATRYCFNQSMYESINHPTQAE